MLLSEERSRVVNRLKEGIKPQPTGIAIVPDVTKRPIGTRKLKTGWLGPVQPSPDGAFLPPVSKALPPAPSIHRVSKGWLLVAILAPLIGAFSFYWKKTHPLRPAHNVSSNTPHEFT